MRFRFLEPEPSQRAKQRKRVMMRAFRSSSIIKIVIQRNPERARTILTRLSNIEKCIALPSAHRNVEQFAHRHSRRRAGAPTSCQNVA